MTQMPINRKNGCKSPQGGEAGFTLPELIISIVLTSVAGLFIFQIVTQSVSVYSKMANRKERADDAVLSLERMSREIREAKSIAVADNALTLVKQVAAEGEDSNVTVKFILDADTNKLTRKSAASDSGKVLAMNVESFSASKDSKNRVALKLEFSNGSDWQTTVYPRNNNIDGDGSGDDNAGGDENDDNEGGGDDDDDDDDDGDDDDDDGDDDDDDDDDGDDDDDDDDDGDDDDGNS